MRYNNILIIQTAFIGDAILASSLLEKLHNNLPTAQISILVRKGNESLYQQHPFLKEVLVWNKQKKKMAQLFKLLFKIRKKNYDCVINCQRFASSGLLTSFSGAKHKAGYKQNPFSFFFNTTVKHSLGEGLHEIERYNQLIEDFTDTIVFKPKLYASPSDLTLIKKYTEKPFVLMAVASAWFTKQLPTLKWIELCNTINSNTTIYLIGGPDDHSICETILTGTRHQNTLNMAGKLTLLQTFALMPFAEMNYVNDSAPLHLASAANAKVTAFFLSTVPSFGFGPLSENSTIKEVRTLKCRPCGVHGYKECPQQHFKCGLEMVI
ncbi:MAG: glycosyltransferase family 9 protein [Bacteroidota bacterium]|jgi:heptosyltransferase-2